MNNFVIKKLISKLLSSKLPDPQELGKLICFIIISGLPISFEYVSKSLLRSKNVTHSNLMQIPQSVEERLSSVDINDNIKEFTKNAPHDIKDHINNQLKEEFPKLQDRIVNYFRVAAIKVYFDKSINSKFESLKDMRSKIYTNLVAILGIFVAIMAATFGGLQLFGSIFRNIDELSYVSFGRAVSLSSVILFGIYLILILLFNGIARLMHHDKYHFSPVFNMYLIFSFIIIFLLGFICSYPSVMNIYFKHKWYLAVMLFIILLLISIIWFAWKYPKCFLWHRKNNEDI